MQAFQRYKQQAAAPDPAATDASTHSAQSTIQQQHLDEQQKADVEPQPAPVMVQVQEEIVLQQPETVDSLPSKVILNEDDPALLQVDSLHTGSWMEFTQDDQRKLRCKLAAIIKSTGRYIFVNRSGVKVLEKTRMTLALEFKNNTVLLLDNALLFDRALESVIGNLRRLKNN